MSLDFAECDRARLARDHFLVFSASSQVRTQSIASCFRGSCRSWNASRRKLLQSDPLVNEQPALPADAAAVSGKTSISADDPVARNHNGNRVCGIGQADCADGFRAAQLSRQRAITQRCTGLDRSECRPNLALKRGASGRDRDRIDRAEIAREVVADRPPNWRGCGAVLYSEVISFRT